MYQDWGVFWHIVWSWFAAVFFTQHVWINRVQFVHFFRESFQKPSKALLHGAGYVLLVASLILSWSPEGRAFFTNNNYAPLTLRTWAIATILPYVGWLLVRRRTREDPDWIQETFGYWTFRKIVDLALVPIAALTILSGFPLIFDGPIDPRGLKYVSKYWHVWPSIVFSVLAFVHGAQAWSTVKAHWRSYGERSREGLQDERALSQRGEDGKRSKTQEGVGRLEVEAEEGSGGKDHREEPEA